MVHILFLILKIIGIVLLILLGLLLLLLAALLFVPVRYRGRICKPEEGLEKLAERFGAPFVTALSDVCQTQPLSPQARLEIARQEWSLLAARA